MDYTVLLQMKFPLDYNATKLYHPLLKTIRQALFYFLLLRLEDLFLFLVISFRMIKLIIRKIKLIQNMGKIISKVDIAL